MVTLVAWALGLAAGIFGFAAGAGVTGSLWAAGLIAAATTGLVVYAVGKRGIVPIEPAACSRELKIVSGLATLIALTLLARLTVFIVDPSQVAYSIVPSSTWEVQHSCLSAYSVSADAASSVPDVYDNALYSMPDDDPGKPRKAKALGPFKIDVYEYPPPFMLAPRALALLVSDFTHLRMLWFGLSGAIALLGTVVVARFLSSSVGTRMLLLSPLAFMALGMISTLQKGNAQVPVLASAMIAMVLFEKRRDAAGGLLLAFVTMSKLYPGMLVVYLLAQRRWRPLAWTAAAGAVILGVSLLDTGLAPYAAFLHHLPGILSGEAFPAFRNPAAMGMNLSIPGLVFKLKLFGVPGMSFPAAKIVGWVYTVIVVAVTVMIARRFPRDDDKPAVWCAVLVLATLRSPFLPIVYGTIPAIGLLCLLAARRGLSLRALAGVMTAWLTLCVYWPIDWPADPRILAVVTLVPLSVAIVLATLALRRSAPAPLT